MLKSSLCNYIDPYILVKENIMIPSIAAADAMLMMLIKK